MSKIITTKAKELPCHLTEDEIKNKGKELAQLHAEVNKESVRQKSVKAELKDVLSKLEDRISKLAHEIRNGTEERNVEVDYVMSDEGDIIKEVRRDTGEIINIRAPYESERQQGFFPH